MNSDSPPIFSVLLGIPALIAWIAYGLCWLLDPRIAGVQSPAEWAFNAAACYYMILLSIFALGMASL